MNKKSKKKAIKQFMDAATTYIKNRGVPAEVEGERVRCAVVREDRGYDVSLWHEPKSHRTYCECIIRNVFPDHMRAAVMSLLQTSTPGNVGGVLGIGARSGDLAWKTFCEAPSGKMDVELIDEVIKVGVGTFDATVVKVQQLVNSRLLGGWDGGDGSPPDDDMLFN